MRCTKITTTHGFKQSVALITKPWTLKSPFLCACLSRKSYPLYTLVWFSESIIWPCFQKPSSGFDTLWICRIPNLAPSREQARWRLSTFWLKAKLTGINSNNIFARVCWITNESFVHNKFPCNCNGWSTNHIFASFLQQTHVALCEEVILCSITCEQKQLQFLTDYIQALTCQFFLVNNQQSFS